MPDLHARAVSPRGRTAAGFPAPPLGAIVKAALGEYQIAVVWLEPGADYRQSRANVAARIVTIPRELDEEVNALAALHEIGHVRHPCLGAAVHRGAVRIVYDVPVTLPDGRIVEEQRAQLKCAACEHAAWGFVERILSQLGGWTPSMEAVRVKSLASHGFAAL